MNKSIYIFRVVKSDGNYIYHNIAEYTELEIIEKLNLEFGSRLDSIVQVREDNCILFISRREELIQTFIDGMSFLKNIDKAFEI